MRVEKPFTRVNVRLLLKVKDLYLSGSNLSKKVGVDGIMVCIEQPNVAVVQGTKPSGGASTWGQAVRSTKQKACWIGEGNSFKLCAW